MKLFCLDPTRLYQFSKITAFMLAEDPELPGVYPLTTITLNHVATCCYTSEDYLFSVISG